MRLNPTRIGNKYFPFKKKNNNITEYSLEMSMPAVSNLFDSRSPF